MEALKKRYWSRNDEAEQQVVQHRLFTKARRLELGVFGGSVGTDPFLSVKNVGFSLGYHFSEYLGAHLMGWKFFTSPSSASDDFTRSQPGLAADTNFPEFYYGGEMSFSPIYGKLSLLGAAIIYYDLHLMGGVGMTDTESGNYFTAHLGIGQQFYLSRYFALKVGYRLMRNSEWTLYKTGTSKGQRHIERTNYSNVITVGISCLL